MSNDTYIPWFMSKPYPGEAGGTCVAITGVHSHYYEGVDYNTAEEKADAHLIAAAPELLQACVTFLQQLGNGELQVYPSDEDGSPDVCELIEAAVIKAGVRVNYQ